MSTQADPSALNEFFIKTTERLVEQNATTDDVILPHIDLLASSHGSFKQQKVTYSDVLKSLKSLRNYCSTGYDNIPVSLIKPIAKYIASPCHNQQFNRRIKISGSMENCSYQSNTESYQPSRPEGLSSDIDSSNSISSVRKTGFTSNNRLH